MIIKLVIIAVIAVGFLMAFSTEIEEHFPNTVTTGIDAVKLDLQHKINRSLETADQKLDTSSHQITSGLATVKDETVDSAEQTIQYTEEQVSLASEKLGEDLTNIQDTSSEFIEENIAEKVKPFNPIDILTTGFADTSEANSIQDSQTDEKMDACDHTDIETSCP